MSQVYKSMSIAQPHPPFVDGFQKLMSGLSLIGLFLLFTADYIFSDHHALILAGSLTMISGGIIGFSWRAYLTKSAGIKNDGVWFSGIASRGLMGWIAGLFLTGFYVVLYWFPEALGLGMGGAANKGIVALFDPLAMLFKGTPASQWFVYGTLYTVAILSFGTKFLWKYRHNRYQVLRTLSVMFFQLFFAFLIPEILEGLNSDYGQNWFDKDMKNMWPLDYDLFDQWHIDNMSSTGVMGWSFLVISLLMIFVVSPFLTYKYGKRWYCSWVCGCGGLAETAGDPFRHLSDKSLKSWKVERWLIHSVLVFSIIMTIAVVYGYLGDGSQYYITRTTFTIIVVTLLLIIGFIAYYFMYKQGQRQDLKKVIGGILGVIGIVLLINYLTGSGNAFFIDNYSFKKWYGLLIGAVFSGVVGVGFYPLMGSRVWCRFGCPMAAILGLQQKFFSRFRITTNGSQCISCGNCSTYCEMGIDVRSYAQKGQDIVRASCVGCGICAAVCPRGVLKLENGSDDIYEKGLDIRNNHVSLK
ncbi:MAG: polyferredoxin [Saprospiraceae bacterium]|jgi:polyferredoxin